MKSSCVHRGLRPSKKGDIWYALKCLVLYNFGLEYYISFYPSDIEHTYRKAYKTLG